MVGSFFLNIQGLKNKCLTQTFPTVFGARHPYIVFKILGGTPGWFIRYKGQGIVTIGGTPGTTSRHTSVPRHPGWESLKFNRSQGVFTQHTG